MDNLKPEIIYESDDFIVLVKPAGMIVNNADTSQIVYTLQDWVGERYKLLESSGSEFFQRGGIVHRLDKETSGIILVALNEKSFLSLQNQFKERTVEKEYTALCHGKLVGEGEIRVPIGRLPWNRMRFGVIPQGREAYTKFKVMEYKKLVEGRKVEQLSLVQVFPKTGRTHQIRVHFQYSGHPIFADSLYAGRKTYAHDKKYLGRHFLHASKITFNNPTSGEKMEFEAKLTPDLTTFLSILQK